jgi:8-oxo-dGTP pyrophosphatase MutT (NUDIX family)
MEVAPVPPEAPREGSAEAVSWMDEVERRLAARPRRAPEGDLPARRAGVLVPLFVREAALWVLFTRRTDTLEHHRGQVSFPGGSEEEGDDDLLATALRETEEELGIAPADVRVLGALPPAIIATGFYVEPYVGAIPHPYEFHASEEEIAELIEAPLAAFFDPGVLETRLLPGRERPTLFFHYGSHVIWGATARMLKELVDALRE